MIEQTTDTEVMEKLEAELILNEYKELLLTVNPIVYTNDIELHLTAKDCAMMAVNNVLKSHKIRDNVSKSEFWTNVKEYLISL